MTEQIKCPACGTGISDETVDRAIQYAHDTGFDEGYEAAQEEREECEAYVIPEGLQCGNCGAIVVSVVDEGVSEDE